MDTGATVRVVTWNVARLFDPVCDSGSCAKGDFEAAPSSEAFQARVDRLGTVLESLDADILLLQEVESRACMEALAGRLGPSYSVAHLAETGKPGSLDVGVLARGSLKEIRGHRDRFLPRPGGGRTRFSRELLEMHLELNGHPVVVFSAHFRSKRRDDPGKRLAEARAAHDILLRTALDRPEALVILGGDLNDVPGSPPLDALLQGDQLKRVAADIPDRGDWTHSYRGKRQALDHLLWAPTPGGAYRAGSARAVRLPQGKDRESDHAPLVAEFSLLTPGDP
ncbi:MAG: endonuclease/exonuclease/phosphatase family protein [Myxococcota bacterium]|nr:endonuclease/exonuclease/phosphatase family protein [Myxococcota bacterium]